MLVRFSVIVMCLLFISCQHGRGHGKRWQMMDKNGDGKVTQEEYNAASQEKFKKMDKNGDGAVSKDEIKEYRKAKGDCKKSCDKKPCPKKEGDKA